MENNIRNTFDILIPIQIDSEDRLFNIKTLIKYFHQFNIIIKECGVNSHIEDFKADNIIKYIYEETDGVIFHKTRILNDLYKLSDKNIVVILDADVIVSCENILNAVNLITINECDAVYPYRFNMGVKMLSNKNLDIGNIEKNVINTIDAGYGYCLIINKSGFESIGCENEDFYGYAPEDWERHDRISKLLNVKYLDNQCYHINHQIINCHNKQPFFEKNQQIYNKITSFRDVEYKEYILGLKNKYKNK